MNTRIAALATAIVSLLSTVAGCAAPRQAASSASHPVVAFAVPALESARTERPARFDVEAPRPVRMQPVRDSHR